MKLSLAVLLLCALLTASVERRPPLPTIPAGEQCRGIEGYAAGFDGRRTFAWRPVWLERMRGDASARAFRAGVIAAAERALAGPAPTVTAKTGMPPSGDKHDYMSWPVYWWETSPGTYVTRDGRHNPVSTSSRFDVTALQEMQTRVSALSLAFYLSGDRRYSAKAAELLSVWFVDPATAMNPNMRFGQAVPGKRGGTTIEAVRFLPLVEAIGLLRVSGDLAPALEHGLRRWFAGYVDWMTGPNAPGDRLQQNNWGLSYDLQLAAFALIAGRVEVARTVLQSVPKERLAKQIEPDGSMPAETRRARGINYSIFTLRLMFQLATLGECVGVDLWSPRAGGEGGRDLRAALDYLIPYVGREDTWPFQESDRPADLAPMRERFRQLLLQAGWIWQEPRYFEAAAALKPGEQERLAWPAPLPIIIGIDEPEPQ